MGARRPWERWLALIGVLALAFVLVSGPSRTAQPQRVSALDRSHLGSTEPGTSSARRNDKAGSAQLVIIDTDIGDDIDDAFAIALALQSPEVKIIGITTAWGNTPLRARLLERFLRETDHVDIPVAVGIEKYPNEGTLHFTQEAYAQGGPEVKFPGAVDFIVGQIRNHPGEITIVAIGPETNLGALIERDADTFRKLKRVVLMGGSVYHGYDGFAYPTAPSHAQPEWNILCDVGAAERVFTSGVPLYVMPPDSTQIKLQELERARLFSRGTALTDALTIL